MDKARYYSKPLEILRCPKRKERKADFQWIRDISLVSPFNSFSIGIFMLTDSEFLSQMVSFGLISQDRKSSQRNKCLKTLLAAGNLVKRRGFVDVLIEGNGCTALRRHQRRHTRKSH